MRTFINTVGLIVIMVLVLAFAMQNTTQVSLNYYFGTYSCSLYVLIIIPFFLGVVAGNLLDVIQRFRLRKELKALKRQVRETDAE